MTSPSLSRTQLLEQKLPLHLTVHPRRIDGRLRNLRQKERTRPGLLSPYLSFLRNDPICQLVHAWPCIVAGWNCHCLAALRATPNSD